MPALLDRIIERPRDKHHEARRHATAYKVLSVVALIALVLQTSMLFLSLSENPLPYDISDPGPEPIASDEFVRILSSITGGGVYSGNRVDVLTNGDQFYAAELDVIRSAQHFIHLECYIFQKGRVTDQFLNALEERARAGVRVNLVIDAIGSTAFKESRFDTLRQHGGSIAWYHPLRWYTWPRANNRTHRELLIVDGTIGFIGGAGFADQWLYQVKKDPQWRDTMVRVQGEAVVGLEATFSENWLESSGEMLIAPQFFPFQPGGGGTRALVVMSSPTSGRSTEARVLFQSLLAKATRRIHITNPYFLPDKSLRDEIVKAIRERGVEVTIITPGSKNDHLLTRRSSRALYGDLLRGGARIFEYQPAMIHAKITLIDGIWGVVGSTNLDSRSFGLNDEVNMAIPDPAVVARLEQDFDRDLSRSRQISYDQWKHRPWWEKLQERFGWLLENQE